MIPSELNPATVNWTATAVSNSPNTTSEMTKLVGLEALRQFVDVGEDQIIECTDQ